jgi:Flp pilus assembly protein TadD
MQNSPTQPAGSEVDALVGQAWSEHYHGQNDNAVKQFRQIVEKYPDHIDANYGLGLVLKKLGQKEEAGKVFQKTKELVDAAGITPQDDNARFQMLSRMVEQQLASL